MSDKPAVPFDLGDPILNKDVDFPPPTEDDHQLQVQVRVVDPKTGRFIEVEDTIQMFQVEDYMRSFGLGLKYVFKSMASAWLVKIDNKRKIAAIKLLREVSRPLPGVPVKTNFNGKIMGLKEAKENIESNMPFNVVIQGRAAHDFFTETAAYAGVAFDMKPTGSVINNENFSNSPVMILILTS